MLFMNLDGTGEPDPGPIFSTTVSRPGGRQGHSGLCVCESVSWPLGPLPCHGPLIIPSNRINSRPKSHRPSCFDFLPPRWLRLPENAWLLACPRPACSSAHNPPGQRPRGPCPEPGIARRGVEARTRARSRILGCTVCGTNGASGESTGLGRRGGKRGLEQRTRVLK